MHDVKRLLAVATTTGAACLIVWLYTRGGDALKTIADPGPGRPTEDSEPATLSGESLGVGIPHSTRVNGMVDNVVRSTSAEGQSDAVLAVTGKISRDDVGDARFDALLAEYARPICAGMSDNSKERWIARVVGFKSPEQLEEFLSESDVDAAKQAEVASLKQSAVALCELYESCRLAAWDEFRAVEVIDRENPHDHQEWLRSRAMSAQPRGLFQTTKTTHVGDREFVLHFNSSHYPQLELELQTLLSRRRLLAGKR